MRRLIHASLCNRLWCVRPRRIVCCVYCKWLALATDKLVFSYYRRKRSETVTYLIVSVGVMFFTGGLIRFIIGPDDRVFTDGERFLLKA